MAKKFSDEENLKIEGVHEAFYVGMAMTLLKEQTEHLQAVLEDEHGDGYEEDPVVFAAKLTALAINYQTIVLTHTIDTKLYRIDQALNPAHDQEPDHEQ